MRGRNFLKKVSPKRPIFKNFWIKGKLHLSENEYRIQLSVEKCHLRSYCRSLGSMIYCNRAQKQVPKHTNERRNYKK